MATGRRGGVDRDRGAVRHPWHGRGHADPERRCLRPGGRGDDRPGARVRPARTAYADTVRTPTAAFGYRTSLFKRAARPVRRRSGDVPVPAREPGGAGAVRRAGPDARRRGRRAGGGGTRARGGARAAPRQGHGARPEPTTTRGARARSSPTRSWQPSELPEGAPAFPQPDGTVKTSAAWLIERAGFAKGYGNGRVSLSTQAHARADQPRLGDDRGPARLWRAEIRDGVRATFGIDLHPEPTLTQLRLLTPAPLIELVEIRDVRQPQPPGLGGGEVSQVSMSARSGSGRRAARRIRGSTSGPARPGPRR